MSRAPSTARHALNVSGLPGTSAWLGLLLREILDLKWLRCTGLSEARLPAGAGDGEERPGGVDGHHLPGRAGHTRAGAAPCDTPVHRLDNASIACTSLLVMQV